MNAVLSVIRFVIRLLIQTLINVLGLIVVQAVGGHYKRQAYGPGYSKHRRIKVDGYTRKRPAQ